MEHKRTVQGVGYNSGGIYPACINTKRTDVYAVWYNMLQRCYDPKVHARCKRYEGFEVAEEWHDFQNFADWHSNHIFSKCGYHLDKDLLHPDSKIYSKETVCFIPQEINKLITIRRPKRGRFLGVHFRAGHKTGNKWIAFYWRDGKQEYLGSFPTDIEAHKAFIEAKTKHIRSYAEKWKGRIEDRAYEALKNWTYPELNG